MYLNLSLSTYAVLDLRVFGKRFEASISKEWALFLSLLPHPHTHTHAHACTHAHTPTHMYTPTHTLPHIHTCMYARIHKAALGNSVHNIFFVDLVLILDESFALNPESHHKRIPPKAVLIIISLRWKSQGTKIFLFCVQLWVNVCCAVLCWLGLLWSLFYAWVYIYIYPYHYQLPHLSNWKEDHCSQS